MRVAAEDGPLLALRLVVLYRLTLGHVAVESPDAVVFVAVNLYQRFGVAGCVLRVAQLPADGQPGPAHVLLHEVFGLAVHLLHASNGLILAPELVPAIVGLLELLAGAFDFVLLYPCQVEEEVHLAVDVVGCHRQAVHGAEQIADTAHQSQFLGLVDVEPLHADVLDALAEGLLVDGAVKGNV